MKYRTLIADDEKPARDRLRMLLSAHADKIEIIAEAENGNQCRDMIASLHPDLVFLDIQMPGLDGFEVLKDAEVSPVVVFCTAHDEYALKGYETNSIDYIVKPVRAERILKTIEKLDFLKKNTDRENIRKMIELFTVQKPRKEITNLPVKLGDRMLFVGIEDILYFEAEEKYVRIFTRNAKNYLCDYPIRDLEEKLGDKFVRIQWALLVNICRIREIDKHLGGKYVIKLDDPQQTRLISGRNYNDQIKMLMNL